jgi:Zn-dependent protease with chaperone function
MDFFQRQDMARRKTKWLVVYFVLGVLGILLAVNMAVGLIFSGTQHHSRYRYRSSYQTESYDPRVFGFATLGTLFVIFCGSTYKMMQLASGGKVVAEMMGGRPVDSHTSDPDERKLLNVVEEMSIASGTPMPQVYVMDHEPGINAFAAGHSTKDTVICTTRGCVRLLTRDELQGVIGHEFSHILNGDMRLNLRLMGLVFGILCIAMFGRILMDTRPRYGTRDRDRDRNNLFFLGIALFIIGWIGVIFGKLIKSAVSRQREFLADAAAVQFTRNPMGLANALKKVGGCGSRIEDPNAEDASHLFFANGLEESLAEIFSTHPPLVQRIKLLDPNFDGKFTAVNLRELEDRIEDSKPAPKLPPRIVRAPQLTDLLGGRTTIAGVSTTAPALIISDTIGTPTSRHLDYAADLKSKLPDNLSRAAREPMSAVALVYAILLSSSDEAMRTKQLQLLQQRIDAAMYGETLRLVPNAIALESQAKLPLVTMAMTALRSLSRTQYAQFSKTIQFLIESDEQIELFEYALQKMVRRQLEPNYLPPKKPVVQYYALKGLVPECEVLLSALAYAGHVDAGPIETAFHSGVNQLKLPQMNLLPASACGLKEVDAALEKLNRAALPLKKSVLNACAETIAADGKIQQEEAELLRAIADSLDCPVPPLISLA